MNPRIERLREESVATRPTVSVERALLITEFYEGVEGQELSAPVKRALAFKHILESKELCILDGELIVGERGPAPKATPTYPEICVHSLEDLEILNSRDKIPYRVDEEARQVYEDKIIPFWQGKSQREFIFQNMENVWILAYEAGIFTEFMEQRPPGHTALGDKIYKKGMLDIKKDIEASIGNISPDDPDADAKEEELKAMAIAADAIIAFAERYSARLGEMAGVEKDDHRKKELEKMADICHRVPAHSPETFWEALQYYWFVHVGVITEVNPWDAFNPGRLDQHLFPYFDRELKAGTLTVDGARELLQAFWIKFNNHPAPPKVGVTARESNTYTDFALINLGGVKEGGASAVNELSYLILDVIKEMRLVQPSSMVQVSRENPDKFIKHAVQIIKTGFGQPSVFNTDAIVQELVLQGKSIEDARAGGASGCVESGAFGKEAYILTGYFNMPKVLEIALNNGVDPQTGKKIGLETGNASTFDSLMEAFEKQLNYFIDIKIKGNITIEKLYAERLPVPFLSLLIDDCVETGKDYHAGGARYNTSYIQGVGLGTITDSLASIKYNVFDSGNISMDGMLKALADNFEGHGDLRRKLVDQTPKYGNDDDYPDNIMKDVFNIYHDAVNGRPNWRGGEHRINLLPTTVHIYFGSVIGALPDGRLAGEPLSEGVSPVQGADRKGPTAVLKSAGKIDHVKTGGTLLNQKFTPQLLEDEAGMNGLAHLIRGYFRMDGHHVQFNVVTAKTLREAQENPEKHRDLIVRVAGYSDYFVDLAEELQDEIIKRTEHRDL